VLPPTSIPALLHAAPPGSPQPPHPCLPQLLRLTPARPCPVPLSGGLISELRPVLAAIPGPGTQAMLVPSDSQMVAWEFLVRSMSEGDVDTACQVLLAFDFPYTLLDFTDLPEANARYLALVEDTPVAYGWGTYVVRTGPADTEAVSEAVIQVPHPIADDRTALQGADLFRRLKARALMIAGAHRCANADFSPCSGTTVACGPLEPYRSSDVAHAAQTAFQAAHKALVPCGGARVAVQLHGNGLAACPDLFISNGTLNPRRTTLDLYASAARRCSGYSVGLGGWAGGRVRLQRRRHRPGGVLERLRAGPAPRRLHRLRRVGARSGAVHLPGAVHAPAAGL
jgi:hypothetical protein